MTENIITIPDGDSTFEIKNAQWNNSEHRSFDVMLNHPEYNWIPYTVADGDSPDTYCYKLWAIKDTLDIQEYIEPVKTLEELQQELLSQITQESDKFEQNKCDSMFITSSLGFRANADRRSLQNVSNLIDLGEATQYKDYDDQFHLLGVQDLQTLATEIKKNGANLYSQKFTMQYQISQIDNIQDLENFQIQFEMLDFTEV